MVTKAKKKAAPAKGAESTTTINPTAAWPFPTKGSREPDESAADSTSGDQAAAAAGAAAAPTSERIHVAQVQLYTDPTKNVVETIAIEQLVESPFNPRIRFDGLQEMAETMKAVGVMQPILVRPVTLPGGVEIAQGSEKRKAYEVIYGHRRTRAAKIAGLATVPAIVRELTDLQAAQLQAIENVQRDDLDAVEEARGYANYLKVHGVTKEQLAAEIGLSRTHVYSRLKLATAIPTVLDALRAGEIYEENALRIARLPSEKLQQKALDTLRKDYRYDPEDGGKRSVRRIQEFLREKFTLQLREAIFDTTDASLLELAGACTSCAKRSGNAPEFADLATDTEKDYGSRHLRAGPDLCTDPDCFDAKKKAHLANKAADMEAKGKTVITGGKARSAIGADGHVKGAYIALKDVKAELAKKGKKPGTDVATVTIQNPRDGKVVEAIAIEALKAAGVKVKDKASAPNHRSNYEEQNKRYAEERRKQEEKAAADTKVNMAILTAVRTAAAGQALSTEALQWIVMAALAGVQYQDRGALASLHGAKRIDDLMKKVGQLSPDKLTTLALDCAIVHGVAARSHEKPTALMAAAKHFGVDIAAIRKEVAEKPVDTKTASLPLDAEQDEEEAAEA